ncbi:hypothetical protein BDK51DRAFT_42266 [Blyttiomyces helicus]|uniref:Ribosomal protein bL31m N-terminal domain-containing protein n=1 Tax=Blyttiomyces helicus TaxID=388810 RepID=A0A4P9W0M9_9FUNG|nr:hypothetical protein BDK51DRAFT_42266 [Blyttiomyces helicus]|eukprot:RKO85644.1 hypothetical protein BDK51DRAFT_42266 [Blyttiomyces helicus]
MPRTTPLTKADRLARDRSFFPSIVPGLLAFQQHTPRPRPPAPTRPLNVNPTLMHQTIVHSDGSTFTLRTTSPRVLLKLTKDSRNHILWNPRTKAVDDKVAELENFARKFGELADDLDALTDGGVFVDTVKKKVVVEEVVKGKGGKGKKK